MINKIKRITVIVLLLTIYICGCTRKPEAKQAIRSAEQSRVETLQDLDGRRIGVQTGSTFDKIVLNVLPDVEISYFNTYADIVPALESNKIDGFVSDKPVAQLMSTEHSNLYILDDYLESCEFGFVLPETQAGDKLLKELNIWLLDMKTSGKLDEIIFKWTKGVEEEKTMPDYMNLPDTNGTLILATEGAYAPMDYFRNGQVVGCEIELAALFCESQGYALKVQPLNFDGILPAVQAGKVNFAAAGIAITEERDESVNFSEPYYTGGTVMTILKSSAMHDEYRVQSEHTESTELSGKKGSLPTDTPFEEIKSSKSTNAQQFTFFEGIKSSFEKTFIRESRWKLFADGIVTTLFITIMSIIFGTLLGFLIFMVCRNGNPIANQITGFCLWLVQGMPMVVLVMILYYVIFGSVAISGVFVAVIGFTLTFGATVFGLLKMGVGAVDKGQYEAAYALGYSNHKTFFKIILPQALPHVLPAYKGEIVGLIKATAIVGYIAVQDLTKMGDIVRSRTYEAFFPLIAVTIIYFVLEGLIGFIVSRISLNFNPKRRKPADILKGVKTDD